MKKLHKILLGRMTFVGILILLQAIVLVGFVWSLSSYFVYLYYFLGVLSMVVVVWIISQNKNPSYKLAWAIPILLFPLFGGLLYVLFGRRSSNRRFVSQMDKAYRETLPHLKQEPLDQNDKQGMDPDAAAQSQYIRKASMYPVYSYTQTHYLSPGEDMFRALMEDLASARHYIYLEYFIIQEGEMWDSVLELLIRKVKEGVDVRVMYDDFGCITKLPPRYHQKLIHLGIQCAVFNPIRPALDLRMNNRDHRKIAIIDGHTAYTGGLNMADEYININSQLGHWKDSAIRLHGEAVWSFTVMFLQLWAQATNTKPAYAVYRPHVHHNREFAPDGYVQPFGDNPFDDENVGELAYLNMINRAKKYVYITTPYLVIDNECVTSLTLAAKSGVDIRIVTPRIRDKWYVHVVTRSYYAQLIRAGVRIYEYTPGFMHSKTFVSDDQYGIVGTINLDYRSLYLHFECGVWLYKSRAVTEIRDDFLATLEKSQEITLQDCTKTPWLLIMLRAVLRVFAPLM